MNRAWRERLGWWGAGVALVLAGSWLIADQRLAQLRDGFDTDARIVHRLLSQRAVEHEAVLATLPLLLASAGQDTAPSLARGLVGLYPQIVDVRRMQDAAHSPDAPLLEAYQRSLASQHPAVVGGGFDAEGRYRLLLAAPPVAYLMTVGTRALTVQPEWPVHAGTPAAEMVLRDGASEQVLQRATQAIGPVLRRMDFAKELASPSQPFTLRAGRDVSWAELPWIAMLVWAGAVVAGLAALRAVLRQRRARERAEALLRLDQVARLNTLGELAAGMAHELNQPLTAVLANTQAARRLLVADPPEPEVAREAMDHAVAQAQRAAQVLTRLRRTIERPQAAQVLGPVDLVASVRKVAEMLEPEREDARVRLSVQGEASVPVQADAVALEQILHNLLTNALHAAASQASGQHQVVVLVARDGAFGQCTVEDSGPGVPEALRARIFEPFFSTREGGLGLGLSLCETLATGMGGSLALAPAGAAGACFVLRLPISGAPAMKEPA